MNIPLLQAKLKRLTEQSEADFLKAQLKRIKEQSEMRSLQQQLDQLSNEPSKVLELETKLRRVTAQRDRFINRIIWICQALAEGTMTLRQQRIKKQAELETNLDLLQIDLDAAQAISEDEQLQKLKIFPSKGKLIG